ncbi:Nup84 protein [Pichia kluyveri]|uniref:Nuclear pore complex protein n=1 Tax=Pichia kluyveri TaxID=36015 RepID=A0AAV5RB63_PICKL|nr:Nup84 protein [Pichia kluyveri]
MDDSIMVEVEDGNIHSSFAGVLRKFRIDFGQEDLRSIALGFKLITYKKLITLYESDPSQVDLISNWVLECKFWTILESLLDVKFNKDLLSNEQLQRNKSNNENICEYSSETVITDEIISSDNQLIQIFTSMKALSDTFKLDFPSHTDNNGNDLEDDDDVDFQTIKWLNTTLKLNNINKDPSLVKNLDLDAPLRTGLSIDTNDKLKDELFFKRAFNLLMSNEIDELKTLCTLTNNWDFALMLNGLNDRIDPIIDLNDYSNNTIPSGVMNKLLRKRTIYQLCQNETKNYEKACYGFLSSDFLSTNQMVNTWEEKLYLYLDNLFNSKLESNIFKYDHNNSNNNNNNNNELLKKLKSPPLISNSIDDILNKLANDDNISIKEQSKNSIRVLIGSIISDNVKTLMNNTIKSLDLLNENDNEENLQNEISNESYLLRILTHLSIILQLIYGEELISNNDYIKLLKCYIIRLMLYKSYDLVPTYISFIPNNDEIIEIYSTILFQFEFNVNERINQINNIRIFKLPLEQILRNTIEKAFNETIEFYPINNEIQLIYEIDEIDKKLYSTIYWFIDSNMIFDALDSIIILIRRFLLVGKIGSAIEFLESISLPKLIDDYKFKSSMYDDNIDDNTDILSPKRLIELTQYHKLFKTFKLLSEYSIDDKDDEKTNELLLSLDGLVKTWLFDLANDDDNSDDDNDKEVFIELRRIYIPNIFNQYFDILIMNYNISHNNKFIHKSKELVNILADESFKIYEIFNSTNELSTFLTKFASISCSLYGDNNQGIYV